MAEIKFSKEQLKASERFAAHRDIIAAFLEDGKSYGIAETERIIEDFLHSGKEEE